MHRYFTYVSLRRQFENVWIQEFIGCLGASRFYGKEFNMSAILLPNKGIKRNR